MKNVALIDSGPIIALFNRDDRFHEKTLETLRGFRGYFITSWPVVTEAAYMLSFSVVAQIALFEWIERGAVTVETITLDDLPYIKTRMKKYSDLPMDLADASLMCIAERENIRTIFSIDSDFSIYRTLKGKSLVNLLRKT